MSWNQIGNDLDGEAGGSPFGDQSGWSVSLSDDGNRVAVGAIFNSGIAIASGHTRVYMWNGTQWLQLGQDLDGEAFLDGAGGV